MLKPSGSWNPDPGKSADDMWILGKAKESPFRDFIKNLVADVYGGANPTLTRALFWSIAQGVHLPIVALLCAILPNLSRLEVYTNSGSTEMQLKFLDLVLQSRHVIKVHGRHISSLRSVEIHGNIGPCSNAIFDIFRTCAHIASMRTIVGTDFILRRYQSKTVWISSVKSVALENCVIDELTIRHIVLGMKQLKQFTYTQRAASEHWLQPRPNLENLCAALLDSVQGTLERLEITGIDQGIPDMDLYTGCLIHFASLHDVTVEYSSLLRTRNVVNRWSCALYAQLPNSVRKVRLDCESLKARYRDRPQIISCLLEVLLNTSAPSLANLKYLEMVTLDERTVDNLIEAGYVTRLAAAGIQLNFDGTHSPDDY